MRERWLFLPVESRWWQEDFGNAALSALPVLSWARLPISPREASSNRNVGVVRASLGPARPTLTVLVTHLGRHEEHDGELALVAERFQSLAAPAILLGDLNATDQDPAIRQLLSSDEVVDATGTLPAARRRGQIDWIFLRGLRCRAAGVEEHGASDHPFYWAEVELPTR